MNVYDLPGITLSIVASPPRVEKALNNIFKECPLTQQKPVVTLKGLGVDHSDLFDCLPDWITTRLPGLEISMEPVMLYGPENQAAAIGICDELMFCAWHSKNGNQIDFVCTLDNQDYTYGLFHPVLVPIFREIYLLHGLLLLHSAGVSCPNGVGALIIAISGGGKTTTALSMVRREARLLADDLIVLKPSPNVIQAGGIPKILNLRDETIGFYEELEKLPDSSFAHQHKDKKSISPTQVYGQDCLIPQANMHVVYFVCVSSDGPAVKRLTVTESLKRLALAHGFSRNQRLEGGSMQGLTVALSHMKAYELSTGVDPEKLGEWLLQHCADHACFQQDNKMSLN